MGFSINIDIGGTFTDFFAGHNERGSRITKTPTTHYDLSVGFMRGIREMAGAYDLSFQGFLGQTDQVRYCTTLGTNSLIERTGPKLGLITTAGFEDAIFLGRGRSWADGIIGQDNKDLSRINKPLPLIPRDMVVGVRERIDSFGQVICPLNRDEILEKLQYLVDQGAMGFVVCLLWSFSNPVHERMIKEVIEEEYPEDYLGSMSVTLSSEVSAKCGEYTRFITAIVNAYIHGIMAEELNKLVNVLRDGGYKKPLILVHNTGGMKKLSRTKAVFTHNAGPVAGLHGTLVTGKQYGVSNSIFTDMGGTSYDIGVITGGQLKTYDFIPVIDRWRTNIPAIEIKSIGAGGGSIAWINTLMGNALQVGPQSAGSMPGPACYDQGGHDPTVTDADLVLGYLNPDNYLGGKILLDPDLSKTAIEEKIARPLGIDVMEAASRIRRIIDAYMGQEVFKEVVLKGHDPRDLALFACGGAGPTHACSIAPHLGVSRVIVPSHSPVSGAFGASTVNIRQVWEKSRTLKIFKWTTQSYSEEVDQFNSVVDELVDLARRDLRLEGFSDDQIHFRLELDMRYGMQFNLTKIASPRLQVSSPQDFKAICDTFSAQYASIYSPEAIFPQGGINVECFYLTAYVDTRPTAAMAIKPGAKEPPPGSRGESRRAYWSSLQDVKETPVFIFESLTPGNSISGPAIIEAADTTYVVEPGWRFTLDGFYNGVLELI